MLNDKDYPQTSVDDEHDFGFSFGAPTEIGEMLGEEEIGNVEIGDEEEIGNTEIGSDELAAEAEKWMHFTDTDMDIGNVEIGDEEEEIGNTEIGNTEIGNVEIGDQDIEIGVRAALKKARDNRQPAPTMKATLIDPSAQQEEQLATDWLHQAGSRFMSDVFIGAAAMTGTDQFPLTSRLLHRFGGGQGEPRVVRVDTEKSYAAFRTENSPELSDLRDRMAQLETELHDHLAEHGRVPSPEELAFGEIDVMGAEAKMAESEKQIDAWMPPWAKGKVKHWREGDFVCASIAVPGSDGEIRICTSVEPVVKCVEEMARHAREAGVEETIIGVLPAMGCVLGVGTVVKEMAAATPAILSLPAADGKDPFIVKISPKANPAVCALAALLQECKNGNAQACSEWNKLAEAAKAGGAEVLAKAMMEAKALLVKAA